MNNLNQQIEELEKMIAEKDAKKNNAKSVQEKADKIKEKAIAEEQEAEEEIKKISDAKSKIEEANSLLGNVNTNGEVRRTNGTNTNENNSQKTISWILGVALLLSLAGHGITLVKQSKTGTIKTSVAEANLDNNDNANDYQYNYGENVVTVSTSDDDKEYIPLTQEAFENLCSNAIKKIEGLGIGASREDIIKFVAVYNINKLRQDNPELAKSIMGTQTVLEVFDDTAYLSATIMGYEAQNLIYNGQILSVADFVFDEEQQRLIRDFENVKLAIVNANQDDRERMTEAWIYSLIDAKSEYRLLDDGSKLLLLRHCVTPIDSVFFKDSSFHSTLTGNARMLMMQAIAPAYDATQEQMQNSIASCTEIRMMDSFNQCLEQENIKTLKR